LALLKKQFFCSGTRNLLHSKTNGGLILTYAEKHFGACLAWRH